MKREPRPACPTPGKVAHRTLRLAEAVAHRVAIERNKRGEYNVATYAYLCPCRRWHLTSWPTDRAGRRNVLLLDVPEDLQRWAITGALETGSAGTGVLPLRSP